MAETAPTALGGEPSLLNLNDDCLLEVFAWLPLLDLCAIRNSCSRLKQLTEYYFARAHKSLNFSSAVIKADKYEGIKVEEIVKILSSFGQQMDALTLNETTFLSDNAHSEILPMLDAFCTQYRLRHLKLVRFAFEDSFITSRSHPFANVEKLTIDKCTSESIVLDELIKKCTSLKHLELVRDSNIDGSCLEQNYPMMQGFTVKSTSNLDLDFIIAFITNNPQLKELNLVDLYGFDEDIFGTVAAHLSELETLTIRVVHFKGILSSEYEAKLAVLLNLQKLRELEISCPYEAADELLNGLAVKNQLESLGLCSVELTDDVRRAIGNLKNLQKLKLVGLLTPGNSTGIGLIAAQLPNLKEFHVASRGACEFNEIIEFVENAPKLETLLISSYMSVIPFDGEQFNRLAETCAKRIDKLKLTVHIDFDDLYTNELEHDIVRKLRRKYSEIVQLVDLSADLKDFTAFTRKGEYFAEEGGAFDHDFYDDNVDYDDYDDYDNFDDYDEYDEYDDGDGGYF